MIGHNEERDYYQVLGVSPAASLAEIAAAFRSLASELHPDVGMPDRQSLAKFKLINEAYEVLSNEQKRREYDRRRHRTAPRQTTSPPSPPFAFAPSRSSSFGSPKHFSPSIPASELDIQVDLPVTPEEARHGGPCDFILRTPQTCGRCYGLGRTADSPCQHCQGKGTIRRERRVKIMLPLGARSGSVIRLQGHGRRASTIAGDLLLRIKIQPSW